MSFIPPPSLTLGACRGNVNRIPGVANYPGNTRIILNRLWLQARKTSPAARGLGYFRGQGFELRGNDPPAHEDRKSYEAGPQQSESAGLRCRAAHQLGRATHSMNDALRQLLLCRPEILGGGAGHRSAIKQRTLECAGQLIDQNPILFAEKCPTNSAG